VTPTSIPKSTRAASPPGTVTPKPAYQTSSGQYCREFQQSITVGGQTQDAYGTACRQPDGTWKVVSN